MKTVVGVHNLGAEALLAKGRSVLEKLTSNPAFASPDPSLAEISKSLDELETGITAAANHDRVKIAELHILKQKVRTLLTLVANYINIASRGDVSLILSSGFAVRRPANSYVPITAPEGIRQLSTPEENIIYFRWKMVPGAVSYTIHFTDRPDPQAVDWANAGMSSSARFKMEVEKKFTNYWVRIQAFGRPGSGPWSTPVMMIATR